MEPSTDENGMEPSTDEPTAAEYWEDRYAVRERIWSGRVNQVLADVAAGLTPGRALELGCGEGGDALWLAAAGWQVTAVDISATAIDRGRAAATAAGVPAGRINWQVHDLATWDDEASYDLVTASFLHSPVEFPRTAVLRGAAQAVAPDGHLLIVSHAAFPPWSTAPDHHEHRFLSPREEIDELDLEPGWEERIAETRPRDATGPDGQHARLDDTVVLLRRSVL